MFGQSVRNTRSVSDPPYLLTHPGRADQKNENHSPLLGIIGPVSDPSVLEIFGRAGLYRHESQNPMLGDTGSAYMIQTF